MQSILLRSPRRTQRSLRLNFPPVLVAPWYSIYFSFALRELFPLFDRLPKVDVATRLGCDSTFIYNSPFIMLQKFTLPRLWPAGCSGSFSLSAEDAASAPAPTPSQEEMIEAFGYFSAFQMGLSSLGFTTEDAEAINRGIARALGESEPSAEMMALVQSPVFQSFIQERVQAAQAEQESGPPPQPGEI